MVAQGPLKIEIHLCQHWYQNTWSWSDNTLAIYLPMTFYKVDAPYCAVLYSGRLTMVTCDRKMDAAFMCETNFTPDGNHTTSAIFLPAPAPLVTDNRTSCRDNHTPSPQAPDNVTSCRDNHIPSPQAPDNVTSCHVSHIPSPQATDNVTSCRDNHPAPVPFPLAPDTMTSCRDNHTAHTFLACDVSTNCSALSPDVVLACSHEFSPPVPFFTCKNHMEHVPYTLVCDFRSDCCDSSDEDFCHFPACDSKTEYECADGKQCIGSSHVCDKDSDCVDGSDEVKCWDSLTSSEVRANDVEPPARVDFTGDGNFIVTPLYSDTCPQTHFQCPGGGYCLPVYVRCNGMNDCPGKEDEMSCDHYTCPGFYRCRHSPICVHRQHLCDGVFQCPQHDDEWLCNVTCPDTCHCYGHAFICRDFFSPDAYPELRYVDASEAGFRFQKSLRVLDLRGCPLETFFPGVFHGLNQLEMVYADNYKLCCSADLPDGLTADQCRAPRDEISSCDALLRTDVFRVFLVFYAVLALIGNVGSFVYRVCVERSAVKLGYEVFVTHLSMADFLMGVYLAIIGIADRVYYGNYRWNDLVWKHSVACKLAGFLSLLSSEVSAFLISLITLERLLVIGFPHKSLRFNRLSAHAASLAVWLVGLLLALVPLLPFESSWEFYSQSGICIPLPITRKKFGGSDYAFGVMIILNFLLFLFIAVGQLLIYWSIRVNAVGPGDNRRKSRDTAVARRLLTVVMTDFLCWFPIGVLGMMARSGVPVSGEINVVIAIFVLPFNSALNPFLYTIDIVMDRRRKMANARKSRVDGETLSFQNRTRVFDVLSESRKEEITYSREEAIQLLQRFLEEGLLTSEQIRRQVWDIYEG
ncbi:hypothetical protein ACOMHN_051536 [Nucella lapillus]